MALTNWNDILNKPKGIDEVPEIALTVEQLSASVLSISEDVGEIALDVSQLSASVLSIGEKLEKTITKKVVNGNVFAMAGYDGNISVTIPVDGNFSTDFNTVTLSKTQDINVGIYGDIGATSATVDVSTVTFANNLISIKFIPSVTLSSYTTAARSFCLYISDGLLATLSKTP